MLFELFCYAVAIVAILGFCGEPRHTTTEATPAPATNEPTAEPIEPAATVTTEPATEPTAEPETEPATEATEPATPPADLSSLSVAELRRRATAAHYQWRNRHGRNRHSSKAELITALMA